MKRGGFTKERFALCEGFEDSSFIREVISRRNLQEYDVSPNIDLGGVSGNSGFETAIIACEPISGFTNITNVVLVADCDDDPVASFETVRQQVIRAKAVGGRNWGIPVQPFVKAAGDPSVTVWMWPALSQPGCLESLLWQVVLATHAKIATCVDEAHRCSGSNAWSISKLDKARIRSFVALAYQRNPAITLGNLWRDAPNLIPAQHALFNPFAAFLEAI